MRIHEHPTGRIVTLAVPERFLAASWDGSELKVDTVTTFDGAEGRFWTAAGRDLRTNQFRVLPDRFADFGLLPPHVRDHVGGPVLDFPEHLADTGLGRAHAIQRGELPVSAIGDLPVSSPRYGRNQDPAARHPVTAQILNYRPRSQG